MTTDVGRCDSAGEGSGNRSQVTVDPAEARKTWRTLEPIHAMIYPAREAVDAYEALGLGRGPAGYFGSRSAPLGRATPELVIATFFNFCPDLVRYAVERAWEATTPARLLAARRSAAMSALTRMLGNRVAASEEMIEAATLARRAAEAATADLKGRPLFAAHAALEWPDEPLLSLWHAQTLLREYRGDGHVAILTAEGISACEALVMNAATGGTPARQLRRTRGWPESDWENARESLRSRGWFDADSSLTATGSRFWQEVEDRTDARATAAYESLGTEGCARLRALCRPWARAVVASGVFDAVSTV